MATRPIPPGRSPNKLLHSTSPYLLQHAFNPVAWQPWGEEAFAEARRRNVPIFLSIGYSTCYWCHVMERESFEHEPTAAIMNDKFVCVKLDREERPDLDEVYMAATITMIGHGGWPMSVFLEPDTLRPFYCGTYYPRDARFAGARAMPTFTQVLEGISNAYVTQRAEVQEQASKLAEAVAEHVAAQPPTAPLDAQTVETALARILAMFDATHGGFGTAPKFPQPVFIEFLLDARQIASADTKAAIDRAIRVTLDAMACGGMHDHLGGSGGGGSGFHRYSVDASWTVPHFEKMLYDQAQMLSVYARAAKIYGDPWYREIAMGIVTYVTHELSDQDQAGRPRGFYSAQDAEVDGREGLNYIWTPQQVREALSALPNTNTDADIAFALDVFGLDADPNFHDPHHPHEPATWVLRLRERPDAIARRMGISDQTFAQQFERVQARLFQARTLRKPAATDDKVLANWNGQMIAALDGAGRELDDASLRKLAADAFDALFERLQTPSGLVRTARGDAAHTLALLEDYAALTRAAVAVGRRDSAIQFVREATSLFSTSDAWFDTRADQPDLFVRACATHDGANPSGFATMMHALLDLGENATVIQALAYQSGRIAASPAGCVESVRALLRLLKQPASVESMRSLADDSATTNPDSNAAHAAPVAHARGMGANLAADAVQVFASVERLTVAADAPAQCTILVQIDPGFHVIAADMSVPGESAPDLLDALVPFRIDIHNGSGIAAYADYPQGTPYGVPDVGRVLVYSGGGRLEIPVVLERNGDWKGNPLLIVRYQACTDNACLPPMVVELDIALDRA